MDAGSIATIIASILSFLGVVLTVLIGNSKTAYRIEQLEKKVEKHNSVVERTFLAEEHLAILDERMKVVNHRIDDLERKED